VLPLAASSQYTSFAQETVSTPVVPSDVHQLKKDARFQQLFLLFLMIMAFFKPDGLQPYHLFQPSSGQDAPLFLGRMNFSVQTKKAEVNSQPFLNPPLNLDNSLCCFDYILLSKMAITGTFPGFPVKELLFLKLYHDHSL
jgi:hypothetical protein